jgi:hypothetical protein
MKPKVPKKYIPRSSSQLSLTSGSQVAVDNRFSYRPASLLSMIPIHLVKTLSTGDLQGSADYLDEDGNVIHSFVHGLYKYQGGFYSFNQITTRTYPQVGWWILLTILIAAVFVILIDSYWPMLFTIYSEINELPVLLHREFEKFHNGIMGMF